MGSIATYGGIQVKLVGVTDIDRYCVVRQLSVTANTGDVTPNNTRTMFHIQSTVWKDMSEISLTDFQTVLRTVESQRKQSRFRGLPTAVHCSAGIGRTGAFVLAEVLQAKMLDGLIPNATEVMFVLHVYYIL